MTKSQEQVNDLLGCHSKYISFANSLGASDGHTVQGVPHRDLSLPTDTSTFVAEMKQHLITHHADAGKILRLKRQLERLGVNVSQVPNSPIPRADKTRKGNLAEVFLSEYICASTGSDLPVYRLRYNSNVEQSMKGDDVIAIDFEAKPPKIFIGEAKFRTTSSKAVVEEMVEALWKSYSRTLPVSLQFVADRLFEQGNDDLGEKVLNYIQLIIQHKFDLRYVGFLMSTAKGSSDIRSYTEKHPNHKLVVISLADNNIVNLYDDCYKNIEGELIANSN